MKLNCFTYGEIRAALTVNGAVPSDRRVLWRMSGGRCFWCDEVMASGGHPNNRSFMTVDHIHQRAANLPRTDAKVGACRSCNEERGPMPAADYWMIWAARLDPKLRPLSQRVSA